MLISIITPVRNEPRIVRTIQSIAEQKREGVSIEHVIVDGLSTDQTPELIRLHADSATIVIREADTGLYDAINKGIKASSGRVVGVLNADDQYANPNVVQQIAQAFADGRTQAVYGNVRYVNEAGETIRTWNSRIFVPGLFKRSWTPAHPTFYTYRDNFTRFGNYRTDFKIASDGDLMYRFLEIHRLPVRFIPDTLVTMAVGGISNSGLRSTWTIYREMRQSIRGHGGRFNDLEYLFWKAVKIRELIFHHQDGR